MRKILFLLVLWAAPLSAAQVTEDPLERQMLDIAGKLRCAVCQNQPVSESNADLAKDMRAIIREQLQAGKSREQIIAYFVERYGDYILLKPPFDQAGALLWLAPPLLLIILGGSAYLFLRRRLQAPARDYPALSAEDQARVRAVRGQEKIYQTRRPE
ncbi:MAG TPA: cytochrome c-type biogenesis protein [Acidiferrobacterales bacterium]|nr:cytochrome c-type biogenesis protein [Acidiferrobacterales bacterium]